MASLARSVLWARLRTTLTIIALKKAEGSLLAPFYYSEILMSTVLGYVLFNELGPARPTKLAGHMPHHYSGPLQHQHAVLF